MSQVLTIIGLGNPGAEYEGTRHNLGARVATALSRRQFTKKITLLFPTTPMNQSGVAAAKVIKNKKAAESLVVVHDDLDLPLGKFKISFGRGAGGHRGVESVIKKLKTRNFIRLRVGIAPATPAGKLKKPLGEQAVIDFILGKFKPPEEIKLKKLMPKLTEALDALLTEGLSAAMNRLN